VTFAYMSSCIRPEIRLPLDQRVFGSDCCEKMYHCTSSSVSLLGSYTAYMQDTFGTHDQSYTFVQPAVQTAIWS